MKRVFFLAFFTLFFAWLYGQVEEKKGASERPAVVANEESESEKAEGPFLKFSETQFDFGTLTEGDKVTRKFPFKNTGNEPLILVKINTTCGCTASDWPRDPIEPGESGEVTVTFNSSGKFGSQNKQITVLSNARNESVVLSIRGVVKRK